MSIPKIIHYCWFGNNEMNEVGKRCIATWKKYLPDYDIIEWNEDNFDININQYVKEAYQMKKWAFVSDYVRLYALKEYGGIYMDADVEVIKNLDKLIEHSAFIGRESEEGLITATMGFEKNHPLLSELLEYYKDKAFIKEDGSCDNTTNVKIITDILLKKGAKKGNDFQKIDDLVIYPKEYFCANDYRTHIVETTENTYTIHHFNASWWGEKEKK